jgi:hypothetical protein
MCEHGSRPKASWVVQHRYSTLLKLYKQLRDIHQSFGKLPFPGKTWGAASDRVVEERKAAIQNYINLAVANTHAIEECDSTVVASVLQAFDHLFEVIALRKCLPTRPKHCSPPILLLSLPSPPFPSFPLPHLSIQAPSLPLSLLLSIPSHPIH